MIANYTRRCSWLAFLTVLFLNGCATNSSSSYKKSKSKSKNTLPRVPAKSLPGGSGDNWRYLGSSQNGQLAIEINESSIKTINEMNNFQDRKTVVEPAKFNYQGLTARYKYSLSWWQLDCNQRQYSIRSTDLYDAYGKLVKSYTFSGADSDAAAIASGSIAELQYNYLCIGSNRSVGY